MLPGSEEELRLREFLFGEHGILTRGPEKNNNRNEKDNEEETEGLNI